MDGDTKEIVMPMTDISPNSQCGSTENQFKFLFSRARGFRRYDRGGRRSRGGSRGLGRVQTKDEEMNGLPPTGEMGTMRLYPDPRGYRGSDGQMGMGPPPPPMQLRGHYPQVPRHGPPPPPPPGFRGQTPHPQGRGILGPGPQSCFRIRPPRGCRNGPVSSPPPSRPPHGRGYRWLQPRGGRHF
ncbi:DNA-binding protein K10 isoform X2 [Syngnathoides biaculeatus]|nr:DNA-binding protein K10 isoform X2 [Syngnathoides biaculeatus]